MQRRRLLNLAAIAAIVWCCSAGSASAALIGHWVHNYGSVIITLDLFDGQPGGKYLWRYTVDNLSYDPNPGSSNGFSGFELFLPSPIPEIADIDPNPGTVPPWDVNCCSGNPVEWDRNNAEGNGIMPGASGVFQFTTDPRLVAVNDDGWFHTWQGNVQTDITMTFGMHVPFVPGLQPPLCGNGAIDAGEECDPPGSITCPPGSPAGAFLACNAECTCEELQVCGNGVVEPGEDCDPPGSITCPSGSPADAFLVCDVDCGCPATCVPVPEVCNNMLDDDCDGLIDCDDTADCPPPCPSIKKDPSTIKFGPPGAGLDAFKSHGRVEPTESVDVTANVVGWVVSNARGAVYRGVLQPSDWTVNTRGTVFRYVDKEARLGAGRGKRDGIAKAKLRITRGGTSYGYKVLAYGDLSAATDPDMTIQFYLGNPSKTYSHSEPWKHTKAGWKATGFTLE